MKKALFALVSVFVWTPILVSCKKDGALLVDKTQSINLPPNSSSVIAANNQFAFNFLKASLVQDTISDNKLISPLSIYLALSMVYNGADNATKDSMANVLQLSGISIDRLNAACNALMQQLPLEDNEVQLAIANSIWYNQNSFQPLASFLDTAQAAYHAVIEPLNFADQNSVNTINAWIAQHTDNKILKVLSSIDPAELIYLINAIYFNGSWKVAFDAAKTHNDDFILQNGTNIMIPFMDKKLTVNYYGDSSMSVIELPYGGGKSYSMFVILPNTHQTINNFASLMNEHVLSNAISHMDSLNLELLMPSWEYSYEIDDMRPALSLLGMNIAFGNGADFSKMYDPGQGTVYINKAIHKTYIKVNEQGTQAAAVTVIGIGYTSAPVQPFIFKLDHPFLYAIVEKQTGTVIFTGTVTDPSQH